MVVVHGGVGPYSYAWKQGATPVGTNSPSYTTGALTVTSTYSVVVTGANACAITSNPIIITVNPLPAAPTITAGGSSTLCGGGSVNLTSSYASSNFWSTGATTQTISVNSAGSYTVRYTDAQGCQATSNAVSVTVVPTAPIVTPSSGPISLCPGQSVTFTRNSEAGLTYQWKNMGSVIGGATGTTYTSSVAGAFNVTATHTASGCQTTSPSVTVVLLTVPGTPATPTGPSATCNAGTNTTYTVPSVANATSYDWNVNGTIINTPGPSLTYNWPNTYTGFASIKVSARNACGAGGISGAKATIVSNGSTCRLGIDGLDTDLPVLETTLFPNPSSQESTLMIKNTESEKVAVVIANLDGKILYQNDEVNPNEELTIGSNLGAGVYLVKVIDKDSLKILKFFKTE
jgi:hypothetical protein